MRRDKDRPIVFSKQRPHEQRPHEQRPPKVHPNSALMNSALLTPIPKYGFLRRGYTAHDQSEAAIQVT